MWMGYFFIVEGLLLIVKQEYFYFGILTDIKYIIRTIISIQRHNH